MDAVQIYYVCLLVFTFMFTLYGFMTAKNVQDLAQKVGTFLVTILLTLPVAGRMFLWW